MEYKYYFTQKAVNDIEDMLNYISVELCNPTAAKELNSEIFKNIEELSNFPDMGLLVENEYLADKSVRRILVNNYTIFYKVFDEEGKIYILRIVYAKRNFNEILSSI
ncbi:MAG: type II toxin-antitoxin system RelE/ParE family toxin [Clostridia bacterium]|nr:type II toxin-antitoxin system RelE/ParE family toxin [Clostridia bacterium]